MHPIDIKTMTPEVFSVFGTHNALLTAGTAQHSNTMTIGWCGLGRIWNVPACTVYVRPERYTEEFMADSEYFSVSVPALADHDRIAVFGTKSGRDTDKLTQSGMSLACTDSGVPYIAESEWVLVCRKVYAQNMDEACFETDLPKRFYRGEGVHRMYIGEVVEAYGK